ncbi:MAG: DUF2079 domain-containing protein [Deltaproteobacteria bacterium]
MPAPLHPRRTIGLPLVMAAAIVLTGAIGLTLHVESVLRERNLARALLGDGLWRLIVTAFGGKGARHGDLTVAAGTFPPLLVCLGAFSIVTWVGGAAWISRRCKTSFPAALNQWGCYGWLWWLLPVAWELAGTAADLLDCMECRLLGDQILPLIHSTFWAGWCTTFFVLACRSTSSTCEPGRSPPVPAVVWGGMAAYFLCFGAMNWMLYQALLVPHGDSAMYEEHLWNLLHRKGFRSYLDDGRLFLGEHVQVIHLLVIPLYVLWPSHLLLELCQSAGLALGAIPVFRMAHRHSRSTTAAALLALAYLLYFPMQYLDIAITFKTFRPNSFEIPFLLFGLDALERSRYRTLLIWLGLALLCQEDAATVIAPLGIWIAFRQARFAAGTPVGAEQPGCIRANRLRLAWFGMGLALFGAAYVVAVIKFVLPWFRSGADVHFAQYFNDLGATSGEIVRNVVTHPGLLFGKLLSVASVTFALHLLAPLGFVPLLSPGRLAVGAPLFAILCLSAITNSPFHHFHAPLVPILFWGGAAGLANASIAFEAGLALRRRRNGNAARADEARRIPPEKFTPSGKLLSAQSVLAIADFPVRPRLPAISPRVAIAAAVWAFSSALLAGLPFTFSPLGFGFWDPYSRAYWRNLYIPGERARHFPAAFALIPADSRVASTDYIHPRFTHHARSYDYSHYRPDVPDDCDYIVIDTRHPYSEIQRPEQVKEYREHPDQWELLEDHTEGYFIVLKRRAS